MRMDLDFYNLKQNPFSTPPDLDNLFLSPSHTIALMAIIEGIQTRSGIVIVTGQEGVGKTTILRACLHRADPNTLKMISVQLPTVSYPDLVAVVARALGLDVQTDDVEALLAQAHAALREEYQAGRNIALIIDEAQHMPLDTLASLSRLVTLEASQVNLLQIVIAGSPELKKMLDLKALHPLKRHIAVHATLSPLTKTESIAYIRDHLAKAAEVPDTIFSRKALKHIVKHARGVPKILNILCVDALLMGAYGYEKPVSAKTVKKMIAAWESGPLTSYFSRWLVGTIGVVAAAVVLGLLWFSLPKTFFSVATLASNSTPPDRAPLLVAPSKRVAPSQPSFPITGDEPQVTQAHPQTSLSQPRIEAADDPDKALQGLKDQESERQTSDRLAEEEIATEGPAQRTPRGANDNAWLYAQHPEHYSVQLVSADNETAAKRYIERQRLGDQATYFHTRVKGKDWYYVLYGSFATLEEAEAARQRIHKSAWIRRFGVLQKNHCAGATELPPQQSLEVASFCATPG